MDRLPENIVNLTALRIERGLHKFCNCKNRLFVIDERNELVTCASCGAYVDPYNALLEIAKHPEKLRDDIQRLLEQRKEIAAYKPYLVVIKRIEQYARQKNMMPTCPKCLQPFELSELSRWVNRKYIYNLTKNGQTEE